MLSCSTAGFPDYKEIIYHSHGINMSNHSLCCAKKLKSSMSWVGLIANLYFGLCVLYFMKYFSIVCFVLVGCLLYLEKRNEKINGTVCHFKSLASGILINMKKSSLWTRETVKTNVHCSVVHWKSSSADHLYHKYFRTVLLTCS